MSRTKVVCAIILYNKKTLVVQRSAVMDLPLKWEFPGGKIEPNESELDCVKREIKEELGIEIEVTKRLNPTLYDYHNKSIELIPFIAKYLSGNINLIEHNKYLLLDKPDLINLDWAEADIPILNEYINL